MDDLNLSKASLDDIVFEQRNKSYGAYLLRKLYDKNVSLAAAISIAIFSLALASPVIIKYFSPREEIVVEEEAIPEEVKIVDVPLDPKSPPPPPIEQLPPPEIKQVKFIPPEPAPDEQVDEPPPPPQVKLEASNVSTETKDGKDTVMDIPDIPVGPVGTGIGEDEDAIWKGAVTKNATFPGGFEAFAKYINNNFSERAYNYVRDRGIKGKVFVYFEVGKDGSLNNVKVQEGKGIPNCTICNEEAVRIVKQMPKWEPAENNGNPVKVIRVVPITIGN